MGSPDLIAQNVRIYLGFFSPIAAVRLHKIINVKNLASAPAGFLGYSGISYFDPSLTPGEPISPDCSLSSCIYANNFLYSGRLSFCGYSPTLEWYITGKGVNYHVTQTPNLITRGAGITGKPIWSFNIKLGMDLGLSDRYWQYINAFYGDIVSTGIITPTVNYKLSSNVRDLASF